MHEGEYAERSFNGRGQVTTATGTRDLSDTVLFQIGFARFFRLIKPEDRQILLLRLKGYNYSEIKRLVDFCGGTVQVRLKKIGRSFIEYFALPKCYIDRYDLA